MNCSRWLTGVLVLQGTKLNDNSNRYPHTCRACGENFPKGRIDSLTAHLTKKCPAISESDRISICLALHGLQNVPPRPSKGATVAPQHQNSAEHVSQAQDEPWSALQTLAEVSRHYDEVNNKPQDANAAGPAVTEADATASVPTMIDHAAAVPSSHASRDQTAETMTASSPPGPVLAYQPVALDLQDHLNLDNQSDGMAERTQRDKNGMSDGATLSLLQALQQYQDQTQSQAQSVAYALGESPAHRNIVTLGGPLDTIGTRATNPQATAEHSSTFDKDLTAEEQLELLRAVENVTSSGPGTENLGVAAAAAARVSQVLVDPDLMATDTQQTGSRNPTTPPGAGGLERVPTHGGAGPGVVQVPEIEMGQAPTTPAVPGRPVSTTGITPASATATSAGPKVSISQPPPMSSMTASFPRSVFMGDASHHQSSPLAHLMHSQSPVATRGGVRLETSTANGNRVKHTRARFDAARRKEVQEVRKIGACIRCRILRKTCSKGSPCDTCRKVLSPRVWKTGCVRTKLAEQLDLFAAGVQAVYSQSNINHIQATTLMVSAGTVIEAAHFPETGIAISVQVLDSQNPPPRQEDSHEGEDTDAPDTGVVMIDVEKEDIQVKVEQYVRSVLPTLINHESSHFARVTLETAQDVAQESNDECLKRSIELWGYIEVMDRERSWRIIEKRHGEEHDRFIQPDDEAYNTICLQFGAAAERKAGATSKALLNDMQRILQDSKEKIGFPMFLSALVLLHCVEKSTWSFKAWDQDNLRPMWPLERPPSDFTNQGTGLSNLLKMLLGIRRALPRTVKQEPTGILVTEDPNPATQLYFQKLQLNGKMAWLARVVS